MPVRIIIYLNYFKGGEKRLCINIRSVLVVKSIMERVIKCVECVGRSVDNVY